MFIHICVCKLIICYFFIKSSETFRVMLSIHPLLRWVEQERKFGWLLRGVVESRPRHILLHLPLHLPSCWVLRDVATLRHGRLREAIWDEQRLCFVLARSWHDLEGFHRADRVSEPIVVVFDIDTAASHHIQPRLELLILRLLCNVEKSVDLVGAHLWPLIFFGIGLGMRVVQIDWHNLLRNWVFEGTRSFISGSPSKVKAVLDIVVAWSRFFSALIKQFLGHETALILRLKDARAAISVALDRTGIVLSDSGVRLLEVNVDSDWLDVVQRVLLVEWQTEISLELHLWAGNMLFHGVRIVLSWPHIDVRIGCQHVGILDKSLLL